MKAIVVSGNDLREMGSWSAPLRFLVTEHKAAFEDLMTKFTVDDLITLAAKLPFNQEVFEAISSRVHPSNVTDLHQWLRQNNRGAIKTRHIAAYVAAAIDGLKSRMMEEYLATKRAAVARLGLLRDVSKIINDHGAADVMKAILREGETHGSAEGGG